MIRLSVMYPATEGAAFDHDYYRNQHIPLVMKTWGLEGTAEIDRGYQRPVRRERCTSHSSRSRRWRPQ